MAYNRLPSVTRLCEDERQKSPEKEPPCSSIFQFPGTECLRNQIRGRVRTEVSFLHGLEGEEWLSVHISLNIIPL